MLFEKVPVKPKRVFTALGVKIFQAYAGDEIDCPEDFRFSTCEDDVNSLEPKPNGYQFDVQKLKGWHPVHEKFWKNSRSREEWKEIIEEALIDGVIRTPFMAGVPLHSPLNENELIGLIKCGDMARIEKVCLNLARVGNISDRENMNRKLIEAICGQSSVRVQSKTYKVSVQHWEISGGFSQFIFFDVVFWVVPCN